MTLLQMLLLLIVGFALGNVIGNDPKFKKFWGDCQKIICSHKQQSESPQIEEQSTDRCPPCTVVSTAVYSSNDVPQSALFGNRNRNQNRNRNHNRNTAPKNPNRGSSDYLHRNNPELLEPPPGGATSRSPPSIQLHR